MEMLDRNFLCSGYRTVLAAAGRSHYAKNALRLGNLTP